MTHTPTHRREINCAEYTVSIIAQPDSDTEGGGGADRTAIKHQSHKKVETEVGDGGDNRRMPVVSATL